MRTAILGAMLLAALPRGAAARDAGTPLGKEAAAALMAAEDRHVRPTDARLRHAVTDGLRRSATFAGMVQTLDHSDVIVYLETAPQMHASLAGRMLIAATASGARYLRIQIAPDIAGNELIALVGHELQHALEVARSPAVHDEASLAGLYRLIGDRGSSAHRYDTMAARQTARLVRSELAG